MTGPASRPDNTLEFRRAMKRSAPETALRAEHTRNCAVLPDRNALLDALPKRGVAMEAGVAFGAYTDAILAVNAPRELHLVDLWDTERYRLGLDAITERHGALIASGGLRIHRGRSVDVLAALPDAMFDWIYIDTDHSFETTIAELRTAARTIKPGGFLAGHDFCTGNVIAPWPYGVVEACNLFCVEAGWQFRFLAMDPRGHMSFALSRL